MYYIKTNSTDVYFNLALEEYIFNKFKEDDVFMLWINEPSVVIGKHQNLPEEVNMKYCYDNNIKIARRLSGGGTVFHDYGNFNYTYITNTTGDTELNFKEFIMPMYNALKEYGLNVSISERNDLKINDYKICGHSQYMRKKRVLHHGCLLFDANIENLKNSLNVKHKHINSTSAKSNRSKVKNIKDIYNFEFNITEFMPTIGEIVLKKFSDCIKYELTKKEIEEIYELRNSKYITNEWIYGQSPKSKVELFFEDRIEIDLDFGKIEKIYSNNKYYKELLENFVGEYYSYEELLKISDNYNLHNKDKKLIDLLLNI